VKSAPKSLDPAARKKFNEIARLLTNRGNMLDQAVVDLVAAYAAAFTRWSQAEAEIAKTGAVVRSQVGAAIANPWLNVSATALRQVVRLAWASIIVLGVDHRDRCPVPHRWQKFF
jgi:P27 family predicted phage terminase small subunit